MSKELTQDYMWQKRNPKPVFVFPYFSKGEAAWIKVGHTEFSNSCENYCKTKLKRPKGHQGNDRKKNQDTHASQILYDECDY